MIGPAFIIQHLTVRVEITKRINDERIGSIRSLVVAVGDLVADFLILVQIVLDFGYSPAIDIHPDHHIHRRNSEIAGNYIEVETMNFPVILMDHKVICPHQIGILDTSALVLVYSPVMKMRVVLRKFANHLDCLDLVDYYVVA